MKIVRVKPNLFISTNKNCIDCGKLIKKGDLRCWKCAVIPEFMKKNKKA